MITFLKIRAIIYGKIVINICNNKYIIATIIFLLRGRSKKHISKAKGINFKIKNKMSKIIVLIHIKIAI